MRRQARFRKTKAWGQMHTSTTRTRPSTDVNGGILGGYPQISRIDLQGSKNFLNKPRRLSVLKGAPQGKLKLAVDCGADIGRVTEGLLVLVAETVDIVEPVENFVKVLKSSKLNSEERLRKICAVDLEDWIPEATYDLIWKHWCVGHLKDAQLVAYLEHCSKALSKGGWIVVKENISLHTYEEDVFDDLDSKSDPKFRDLFARALLHIVKSELQTGFPEGLWSVSCQDVSPAAEVNLDFKTRYVFSSIRPQRSIRQQK